MKVVKILAIVVVTSVVTVLCIRSGQAIVKASVPAETVYQTTTNSDKPRTGHSDGRPDVRDPGRQPYDGDPGRSYVGDPGGPDVGDSRKPETDGPATPEAGGPRERNVGNPGRLVANDSRSENATGTDGRTSGDPADGAYAATGRSLHDGRFAVGQSGSKIRAPPTVVRDRQIPNSGKVYVTDGGEDDDDNDDDDHDDRGGARDDDHNNNDHETNVILDAGVYHAANRYEARF